MLSRSFIWHTRAGKDIRLNFRRFLDMEDIRLGCQQISITPIGFDGELTITPRLDWDVVHEQYRARFWEKVEEHADGLTVRTKDRGFTLYAEQRCEGFGTLALRDGEASVATRLRC